MGYRLFRALIFLSISIGSFNPARKAEYKRVSKLVKAKDPVKKSEGLDLVSKDYEFFTEGGCLLPLVDSLVPTKVSLKICFRVFIMLFDSNFTILTKWFGLNSSNRKIRIVSSGRLK